MLHVTELFGVECHVEYTLEPKDPSVGLLGDVTLDRVTLVEERNKIVIEPDDSIIEQLTEEILDD